MKRLFKLNKKKKQPVQSQQIPASQTEAYSDEYEDDEQVHEYEIAQENYLVSVALATSAQEFQAAAQPTPGSFQSHLTSAPGAASLSRKYYLQNWWVHRKDSVEGHHMQLCQHFSMCMGLKHIFCCCSLGYEDCIPDGFYEAFGDFPELVDPGELPTLAALKHAQIIDGDLREVSNSQEQKHKGHDAISSCRATQKARMHSCSACYCRA